MLSLLWNTQRTIMIYLASFVRTESSSELIYCEISNTICIITTGSTGCVILVSMLLGQDFHRNVYATVRCRSAYVALWTRSGRGSRRPVRSRSLVYDSVTMLYVYLRQYKLQYLISDMRNETLLITFVKLVVKTLKFKIFI